MISPGSYYSKYSQEQAPKVFMDDYQSTLLQVGWIDCQSKHNEVCIAK